MVFSPSEIDLEEEGMKEFLFYCHIFFIFSPLISFSRWKQYGGQSTEGRYAKARLLHCIEGAKWREKKCRLIEHDGLFKPIYAFHQLHTQFIVSFFVFGKIEKGRQSINLDCRKISMEPNFFYVLSGEITVWYKYEITASWIQGI